MDRGVDMQEDSIVQLEGVLQRFSYDELSEATGGFSEESTLGHGGFGVVYKAELKSGTQVAIKRMHQDETHSQGLKEFKSEVFILSQLSHRNLIKLQGWCEDVAKKEYMLVYDLLPSGSLDDALFKPAEGTAGLSWAQKFKVLTGAADGLDYLHHGLKQQVIHRDIKCSNILLDNEWNAKLGDFGISRMVDHQGRAPTTNVAGTTGYMAPELFSEFQFTDKADVFAFGVVILEVACGRRVLPSRSHKMGLVQWVGSAHSKGDLLSIVDKRLTDYDTKQMKRVLKVGLLCTQLNRQDRPSMRRTAQMLAGDVKVPAIRALKPTSKAFYTPPWLLSMMKTIRHKDAPNGSSSLDNLNLVETELEAGEEFTPKELKEETNGSASLNMPNLVDIDPEPGKEFTYKELNEATNGSSPSDNLNLVETELEAGEEFTPKELKEETNGSASLNMPNLVDIDPEPGKEFTYKELNEATNGFSSANLFRKGSSGKVYKGTISGNVVEMEVLNSCMSCNIFFFPEVEIIKRVRHRNLVSVLGYVSPDRYDRHDRLLVYEHFPNGTLEGALHGPGAPLMDWVTRMNIALGTARGLAYLHDGFHWRIIHGNVTASNILLNNEWDALVGSFGIRRGTHYPYAQCSSSRRNKGYVDPEYDRMGRPAFETDVYCFGVVLLELITGMQAWDETQRKSLLLSAKPLLAHALESQNMDALADPNLMGKYMKAEMFRMLQVAALCIDEISARRPDMKMALRVLQGMSFLSI